MANNMMMPGRIPEYREEQLPQNVSDIYNPEEALIESEKLKEQTREDIGSRQQTSFIEKLIDMFTPKAHSEINALINQPIEGMDDDFIMNLVMGMSGGGGANIGKFAKNLFTKINARNAIGLRNLRSPVKKGAQTMSSGNKEFISEGWRKWNQLTDGAKTGPKPAPSTEPLKALLPLLLASMAKNYPMLEPLQGDVPNIGRPPKLP